MSDLEQSLLNTLGDHPEDWSVRMLLAEKMLERDAPKEAGSLLCAAPVAPKLDDHLYKLVDLGGTDSIPLVEEYLRSNPANAYAHELLAGLCEACGKDEQAIQHRSVAAALGGATATPTPEISPSDAPPAAENLTAPEIVQHEQVVSEVAYDEGQMPEGMPPPPAPFDPAGHVPDFIPPPDAHAAEAGYGETYAPVGPPPKEKKGGSRMTAIIIAVGVHVLIGILAALVVILPQRKDEPEIVAAVIGPPAQKREMQKKNVVKQTKKTSASAAAAAPLAQLMRANAVAKIAMPEVTRTSTGPLGIGDADFGSGGFGSGGGGMGSGASFFGGSSTGNRFLFVIDHSGSMKPNQVKLRNDELERALKSLKGVQYQVLLFAGGAYYASKGWSIKPGGGKDNIATGPKGTYRFKQIKGAGDYEFDGPDTKLPQTEWLSSSSSNVSQTMNIVKGHRLFYGTDWELALRVGHKMSPPPDVIFFMSDGTGGNDPPPILSMNSKNGKPVINTVAMQTTQGMAQFAEIAKKTKGSFTIVDKDGKPIDGFDYQKNPGKFRGRL